MEMALVVRTAIADRLSPASHATLWAFDNIASDQNVANTNQLFATFAFDDNKMEFTIDGRKWSFGVVMADNGVSGWVILRPVLTKAERRMFGTYEPPQQTRKTLEEYRQWWADNNPYMLRRGNG